MLKTPTDSLTALSFYLFFPWLLGLHSETQQNIMQAATFNETF